MIARTVTRLMLGNGGNGGRPWRCRNWACEEHITPEALYTSYLTSLSYVELPVITSLKPTTDVSSLKDKFPYLHAAKSKRDCPPGEMHWQLQLNFSSLCPPNLPPEGKLFCRSPITPNLTPPQPKPQTRRLLWKNHRFYRRERLKNVLRGIRASISKQSYRNIATPMIFSSNPLKMRQPHFHN
jgi:hypothetical protein